MQRTIDVAEGRVNPGRLLSRERAPTATSAPDAAATLLLDVQAVAVMVGCSSRNIYRLSDGGRMPRPVRIGRLVRWRTADIEAWIAAGCPSCR